jgi:glycosyltransferase involved in cell wall biosynthesis
MPLVSVVMPVFDTGEPLREALSSLDAQTFRDFETVIVDDGSTDSRTRAILEHAAARPRTTVHRTPNRGPARARNLAVEHAAGRYILPLDADDYLAPACLARTVAALEEEPATGVAYTWIGLVGAHHGVWRTGGFSLEELLAHCTLHPCSLYRREVWTDVGGYDPRFVESCEDWDFWIGAASRGWRGRCVPEVLVYYRRSESGRDRLARSPGVSGNLMRAIVRKHRADYAAHLEGTLASMYERFSDACLMVERAYNHPAVRVALRLRDLVRRPGA